MQRRIHLNLWLWLSYHVAPKKSLHNSFKCRFVSTNPRIWKIFHLHLTILQRMWEIISPNTFDNAVSEDYHCLRLLWSVIFSRSCVGSIVTKFNRRLHLFGLILKWCAWIFTTLIFFTDFITRIAIYVFTSNILTICVVTNFPFISLKTFLVVFNWFCNFINWFKGIIYFWSEQIDIFFVFFN